MKKILCFLFCFFIPILSQAFIVFDPSNYAQNMITASNSATALLNQAHMLQNQLSEMQRNGAHLGHYSYQDLARILQQLDYVTEQGQSLSYSMSDMSQRFNRYYPDYSHESNVKYPQAYHQWNQTTLTTLRNSLSAVGITADPMGQETILMQQLKNQNENAMGNMQVLQVSNELSLQVVQQLQLLKRLMAAQQNAQTTYMARQLSQASYQDRVLSDIAQQLPMHYPSYHEKTEFGLMNP